MLVVVVKRVEVRVGAAAHVRVVRVQVVEIETGVAGVGAVGHVDRELIDHEREALSRTGVDNGIGAAVSAAVGDGGIAARHGERGESPQSQNPSNSYRALMLSPGVKERCLSDSRT